MTDTIQRHEADIQCVKSILLDLQVPEGTYNDYQVNILAQGYTLKFFQDAGFTRDIYFEWLSDPKVAPFETKFHTVIKALLGARQDQAIEQTGWALIGVGPGKTDPSYTYSVGLTAKTGFELVVVNLPLDVSQDLMNEVCRRLTKGEISVNEPFDLADFLVMGEPVRAKIIDLDMGSLTAQGVKGRTDGVTVTAIKQLWLGDENNCLPDEDGYDRQFVQELKEDE